MRSLFGGRIVRQSLPLISGTILTQLALFLCSPLLSRLFGPADFGAYANYTAWVSVLALISCLRYEHAIIVAPDELTVTRLFALAVTLSVTVTIGLIAIVTIGGFVPAAAAYLSTLGHAQFFIPLGVLVACVTSVLTQVQVKTGHFRRLARVTVAQVGTTLLVQLALGVAGIPFGLVVGAIVGPIVAAGLLGVAAARDRTLVGLRSAIDRGQLARTARQFHRFPRYSLPADLLAAIAQQFTPVFVAIAFSPAAAGLYAFAVRIVRVPLIVVSTALTAVLRKEGADELRRSGNLSHLTRTIVRNLALIGAGPFLIAFLWGGGIFATFFGPRWRPAGELLQVLSPGMWLEFVAFPLAAVLLVTHKQRYSLIVQAANFLLTAGAIFFGQSRVGDFRTVCIMLSAIMVVTNAAAIGLSIKAAGGPMTGSEDPTDGGAVPAAPSLPAGVAGGADIRS